MLITENLAENDDTTHCAPSDCHSSYSAGHGLKMSHTPFGNENAQLTKVWMYMPYKPPFFVPAPF
jgi:hypothetical protein